MELTLKYCVNNPMLPSVGCVIAQISHFRVMNLNQCCRFVQDLELMLIGEQMITRAEFFDRLIPLIQEHMMAMTMAIKSIVRTFESG